MQENSSYQNTSKIIAKLFLWILIYLETTWQHAISMAYFCKFSMDKVEKFLRYVGFKLPFFAFSVRD